MSNKLGKQTNKHINNTYNDRRVLSRERAARATHFTPQDVAAEFSVEKNINQTLVKQTKPVHVQTQQVHSITKHAARATRLSPQDVAAEEEPRGRSGRPSSQPASQPPSHMYVSIYVSLSLSLSLSVYIYMCINEYIYIYIYIYIYK